MGKSALPEQGLPENRQFTYLEPENETGVAAESQVEREGCDWC